MFSFLKPQIKNKSFTPMPNVEKMRCDRALRGWFTPTPVFAWFCEVTHRFLSVFASQENNTSDKVFIQQNIAKQKQVWGFTLFELLVSISIMLLMTMVIIFNYNDFRDNVGLTTATQDLSLGVREMQSNALGVKEYIDPNGVPANDTFDIGYGLRFYRDYNSEAETYSVRGADYTLFRDFLDPLTGSIAGKYDEISDSVEFIESKKLPTGYVIRDICMKDAQSSGNPVCFEKDSGSLGPYAVMQYVDVVFTRPSSNASIHMYNTPTGAGGECGDATPCTFDYISIEIVSEKTGTCSAVRIYPSGQLSTGESCISGE